MAVFGRLDVFYPDGRIETFSLEGETVSVGRAEGNTVALDTETISRYHFSITNKDGKVTLTDLDSSNGTYMDGVQLSSNDPFVLENIEEIQIGHLRIIYHPGSDSPTIPVSPMGDATQPSNQGFRISLEMTEVNVWPASSSSVEIAVTNSTEEDVQYQVVATGLPDGWAKINRPIMMIGGLDTSYALLNIKPARRSDTPPTAYTVSIKVSPVDESDNFVEMELHVNLKGFGGFGVALSPEVIEKDDDIHLYMLNQGNEPLTMSVFGFDPTNQLQFELPQGTVQVGPGQRTQVTGQVLPQNRPLIGQSIDIPFAMVVKAHTESAYEAAVPGTLHVEPSLSTWMLTTIGGILIATVLALFVLLSQSPEPSIQSFAVSANEVEQGVTIDLSWSGSDVETYRIVVNNQTITNLSSDSTSYALETDRYTDPIIIELLGIRDEVYAAATQEVYIYEAIAINSFEADRLEMVRNISSTLAINWDIKGAVDIELTFPDGFIKTNASPTYSAIGSEVLIGIAETDFMIELSAENEIGDQIMRQISITTVDPECTPIQEVLLHEGPDSQFSHIETAVPDVPVLVIGTDATRAWLQVEVGNGTIGWGFNESFACEGFTPSDLPIIADAPVLPSRTPTLIPTPTNLPTATPTASLTPTQSPTVTLVVSVTPAQSATPDNPLRQRFLGEN